MNKTITTIIPFYNCEKTLSRMLDSILSGTVLPYEIILINDGSDDASLDIAYDYAQKFSLIRVLSQDHMGVSAARNLGIRSATGYWISFLDADDYIEPDMYAKMLDSIAFSTENEPHHDNQIDGCICGYFTHVGNVVTPYSLSDTDILSSEDILKLMYTEDSVRGFLVTRLFRADLVKELSFDTDIKICEDLLFQTRLFVTKSARFTYISAPLYHYIQGLNSATTTHCFFDNNGFIYSPAYKRISKYISDAYVLESYNSVLEFSMYTLLNHYRECKNAETLTQIKLLRKELSQTKLPFLQKSKRRIAYEIAPVLTSFFTHR